jgi:hypothetical protein
MYWTESKLTAYLARVLATAALLLAVVASVPAQGTRSTDPLAPGKNADESTPFAGFEEEIRAKQAIKLAEREHRENVVRGYDLSYLGADIVASFKRKNSLDRDEIKKLDKLEKLTKAIRRAAGGSDDDETVEVKRASKGLPEALSKDLPATITKLGELTESVKDLVVKTPRRVVSMRLIEEANVLLEVIRSVRGISSKA